MEIYNGAEDPDEYGELGIQREVEWKIDDKCRVEMAACLERARHWSSSYSLEIPQGIDDFLAKTSGDEAIIVR